MIEPKDIGAVYKVSPFLELMTDLFCRLCNSAGALFYIPYVDIFNLTFRHGHRLGWPETEVDDLMENIMQLKKLCDEKLVMHEALGMGTSKWHVPRDFVDYLRDVGNVHVNHKRQYKGSQILFKQNYRHTSKKRNLH